MLWKERYQASRKRVGEELYKIYGSMPGMAISCMGGVMNVLMPPNKGMLQGESCKDLSRRDHGQPYVAVSILLGVRCCPCARPLWGENRIRIATSPTKLINKGGRTGTRHLRNAALIVDLVRLCCHRIAPCPPAPSCPSPMCDFVPSALILCCRCVN